MNLIIQLSLSKDGESSLSSDLVHHATDLLGSPEVPSPSTLDPSPEVPVFSNQLVHRKPCLVRGLHRAYCTFYVASAYDLTCPGFLPRCCPRLLASGTKFIHLPSLPRPGSKFTSSFSSVKMSFGYKQRFLVSFVSIQHNRCYAWSPTNL